MPGILIIPQDQTERLLLAEVQNSELCEVRFGQTLLDYSQDEDGITARVSGADGEYCLRAQFLIGCDGAHSRVREKLGWKLEGKTYPVKVLLVDAELNDSRDELPWPRTVPLPSGVLAALRYAPHRWRIIHSLVDGPDDETALSQSYINSLVYRLWGAGEVGILWKSVFRIHRRHSKRWFEKRVVLCGDAAHLNSPAGGQGMNSGLEDAHNLGWKLAAILNGGDARVLLQSYETERKYAVMHGVERYTDLLTSSLLLATTARRNVSLALGVAALRFGFVRRRLMLRAAMLDGHYPTSPIVAESNSSLLLHLAGRRAPDGEITNDTASKRLLDLVFPHATLLLFDDGKLPRWNEDEVRAVLPKSSMEIKIEKVLSQLAVSKEKTWRDASGAIFSDWKIETSTAALVRPDGHIGWISQRPSHTELHDGVMRALGIARI
jgi:2-polyprenyl-6-methoxyphenol hydroxylase-like FAD-dependent oxidoreductase